MKYRTLGSSGLIVSRITLGTMTFGAPDWGCDEKTSHAILKKYGLSAEYIAQAVEGVLKRKKG